MKKRIFKAIFLISSVVSLASIALIMGVLYEYFTDISKRELMAQTEFVTQGVESEGLAYFKDIDVSGSRITWIENDGTIIYDSGADSAQMENHMEREEIKEALEKGTGDSIRYSSTLTERSLYFAKLLPDGTIIRLSEPQHTVVALFYGLLLPIAVIFLMAFLAAVFLAHRLSRQIAAPFGNIDLENPMDNNAYEELDPLLEKISHQQRLISEREENLKKNRQEFNAVLEGMTEGVLVLGAKGQILSINNAAERILKTGVDVLDKNILHMTVNNETAQVILKALDGVNSEETASFGNAYYRISGSPVVDSGVVSGAAIFLFDITDKKNSEQMRREFTANVSHELKTPLHTISGYAEMLDKGMVPEEDRAKILHKILAESQRMTVLINDIMNLSHLDEGAPGMEWEKIDMYEQIRDELNSLKPVADEKKIKLELIGSEAYGISVLRLFHEVMRNLIDNAIKYNKPEGCVKVTVASETEVIVVTVEDTGIGIPKEDLGRIYERFYRVNKSRSRDYGGTGLGLSIVKHALRILKAKIDIASTLGQGTIVTVEFPREVPLAEG